MVLKGLREMPLECSLREGAGGCNASSVSQLIGTEV